jgi:hypothetical protein
MEDIELQFRDRPFPGFRSIVGSSVRVGYAFGDGDIFDIGGVEIETIHTPGHSNSSSFMLIRGERVLITGDAVPLPGELPIYEDPIASIRSLERPSSIKGIEHLLSAWDTPRDGQNVPSTLRKGIEFLRTIDMKVMEVHGEEPSMTDVDMCTKVLKNMGKGNVPPMPLVIRSFRSNIASHERCQGRGHLDNSSWR